MKNRQASTANPWREYTDEHTRIKSYLSDAVNEFETGERDPIALVGPYRTGKTQLLYETFEKSWNQGVPALYTDANTIINEFDSSDSIDIADWLTERTHGQAEELASGSEVDWLPNVSTAEKQRLTEKAKKAAVDTDKVVLLVDEIEQAYTRLRRAEFVDDDNPLRLLLDGAEDILQIWTFGLVSAYELGEADYARFDEQRLPILNVENIAERLVEEDKDPALATGIWWLSRGRIGWANKLVDECPNNLVDLSSWVVELSEEEFEGITPIDQSTWTDSVAESNWDEARRAVLFDEGQYSEWEIKSNQNHGFPIKDFAATTLEIFRDISTNSLSGTASQLLERNLSRLTNALCPIQSDKNDRSAHLPVSIFASPKEIESFFDLLGDLIISFEAGGPERARATQQIHDLDVNQFQTKWSNKQFDVIESETEYQPWTIRPSILSSAYPAVGVNPANLTDQSSEYWEDQLSRGIKVLDNVPTDYIDHEVRYCPNEDLLQKELEAAGEEKSLNKVYVILTSLEESEFSLSNYQRRLRELNRIHIHTHTATRLWDFILQLYGYLFDVRDYSPPISESRKTDAVETENNKEVRNTIETLYEQLGNITETSAQEATSDFKEFYSRSQADVPIWGENLYGESEKYTTTPPGVYGSASLKQALAYTVALSRTDKSGFSDIAQVESVVLEGIDDLLEEVDASNEYGYTQFVRSTLTSSGLTDQLWDFASRYEPSSGQRDRAIGNFQELMTTIAAEHGKEGEKLWRSLVKQNGDFEQAAMIENTDFQSSLGARFAWGILLEAIAVNNNELVQDLVLRVQQDISDIEGRLSDIQNEIGELNDELGPYKGHGAGVEIQTRLLDKQSANLDKISVVVDDLEENCKEDLFCGVGVVYAIILDNYIELFEKNTTEIELIVYSTSLRSINRLKGQYDRLLNQLSESSESDINIFDELGISSEEVRSELNQEAEKMFNFQNVVSTSQVGPTNQDAFETITDSADAHADELEAIAKSVNELERLIDDRRESQEELRQQFKSLAERVVR